MHDSFNGAKLSWVYEEPMTIVIKYDGKIAMKLSMHEAMESAGYANIMEHVRECNRTPWLKRWQEERMQDVYDTLKAKDR